MRAWFRRKATSMLDLPDWHLEGQASPGVPRSTACGYMFSPEDEFDQGPHGPPPQTATCPKCRAISEREADRGSRAL